MISIIGPTSRQVLDLQNDRLLIIHGASWDDYWTLANEDLQVEFIREMLFIHSPASLIHEEIFGYLLTDIRVFLQKYPVGKVFGSRFPMILSEGGRVEPDLLVISNDEIKNGLTDTEFHGTPSWIIEIISPSYREHDTKTKFEEYRKIGLKEYWIIDYESKIFDITIFNDKNVVSNKKITDGILKPKIPGFEDYVLNIDEFWADIIKNIAH